MSAPIAEPSITVAPSTSSSRGVGAVLGVSFGLALIAACVVFVLRQKAGGIDGDARMQAAFDVGALPYRLQVVKAARLFASEENVILADPAAEPEPEKQPAPEPKPEKKPTDEPDASKAPYEKPFDWSKIPLGEARPPLRVSLVWYPPAMGDAQIKQRFVSVSSMPVRDIGDAGGLAEMEAGTLVWGEYAPEYVHQRRFEPGRTFRDELHVNLSTPGQYCVMVVTWPRNSPGTKDHAVEILKALTPKPAPAATER